MNSLKKLIRIHIGFYSRAAKKHSKWVDIWLPSPRRGQDQCGASHFVLHTGYGLHTRLTTMWYNVVQCGTMCGASHFVLHTGYGLHTRLTTMETAFGALHTTAFCTVCAYNVHKTLYAVSTSCRVYSLVHNSQCHTVHFTSA